MPTPWSVGDEISIEELDQSLPLTLTAGETINGATLPVAIYTDDSTNEIFACDGNDQVKLEFIGFAVSNSTDGNDITIQTKGAVSGFTGLDTGKKYYVQDDKTIGTAIGTYEIMVGIAISATQILIFESPGMQYCGSASLSISGNADLRTGIATSPAIARFVIIAVAYTSGDPNTGDIFLSRKGKTSGAVGSSGFGTGNAGSKASASWGGETITVTSAESANDNNASLSGTCYFYR